MNFIVPIDSRDHDLFSEFMEAFEDFHLCAENMAIAAEKSPEDTSLIYAQRDNISHLHSLTVQLQLLPVSESLSSLIEVLNNLITWKKFAYEKQDYEGWNKDVSTFTEFILMIVDRLALLTVEMHKTMEINLGKAQQILVALQYIEQAREGENLNFVLEQSIRALQISAISDTNPDIELFESENYESKEKPMLDGINCKIKNEPSKNRKNSDDENKYNTLKNDTLPQIEDYITRQISPQPWFILGQISDTKNDYSQSRIQFILRCCLAINSIAGQPINPENLALAICVHDIALINIPDVLSKAKPLSPQEVSTIQEHPSDAAKLITAISGSFNEAHRIVLEHHERVDGSGYPRGLSGTEISDGGKLLAIVDSFYAMMNVRPYKKRAKNAIRAISEINACSNTLYDAEWIEHFNLFLRYCWLPKTH